MRLDVVTVLGISSSMRPQTRSICCVPATNPSSVRRVHSCFEWFTEAVTYGVVVPTKPNGGACVRLDDNLRTPGLGLMICKNGRPVGTPVADVISEHEIKNPRRMQLTEGKGMGGPWSVGDRQWADFVWKFEHGKLPRRTPRHAYVAHVYVARPVKCSASAVLCVVNGVCRFPIW